MSEARRRRGITAAGAIRGVLVIQLAIAAILVIRDLSATLPRLSFDPAAPRLTAPVSPGDQRRRYDPDRVPAVPGQPGHEAGDIPSRLLFETRDAGLRLTGVIAPGDADRFTDWLAGRDLPGRVALHSTGGSVMDALMIGRAVRAAGSETAVEAGAVCLSACPYILAAGTARTVDPEGFVGVHQHSFGENELLPAFIAVEDIQRGQSLVVAYLDEMGIDLRLMQHSLATPPDEIYILTPDELKDYALVTDPAG